MVRVNVRIRLWVRLRVSVRVRGSSHRHYNKGENYAKPNIFSYTRSNMLYVSVLHFGDSFYSRFLAKE